MGFSPNKLLEILAGLEPARRYCVAFSGGLDSRALLAAMHQLQKPLTADLVAVHVDHSLHQDSGMWVIQCQQVCEHLGIPLTVLKVNGKPSSGESPEAAARQARYQALADWLQAGDCLLTAHQQDDQAETVLLQLLRGSGVHGLAAMPVQARLGPGCHARPLLSFTRAQLHHYAVEAGLQWLEDPSNQDRQLDRNRLRKEFLPDLRKRWPSVNRTLARVASHQAEAAQLLDGVAREDLQHVVGSVPGTLSVSALVGLGDERRRNVLRYWLRSKGFSPPSQAVLKRCEVDLLQSRWDSSPRLVWEGVEVRRYRDFVYAFEPLSTHDPAQCHDWITDQPLRLVSAGGVLSAQRVTGEGLKAGFCEASLNVRFRRGGERCCPAGRQHHHRLKHLFQENGIPPWERDRTPLIYIGDQLAAVAGLWICQPFQAVAGEAGLQFSWKSSLN